MATKFILTEKNVLNLLEKINEKGIINLREYLNNELNSNYPNFIKKLKIIKEKYPEKYDNFVYTIVNNYEEYKEIVKIVFIYMSVLIKNGIELEDGSFRNFDLFDYYQLKNKYFENFYKKDLLPILDELVRECRFNRLEFNNVDDIRKFLNSETIYYSNSYVDSPVSKKTILISNDGLEIDEKEYLIKFMEDNNVTFTYGNYVLGLKKMLQQRQTKNNIFDLDIYLDCYAKTRKR